MRRSSRLGLLLVAVALIVAGAVSPAQAAPIGKVNKTYTDRAGIVHYAFDPASRPKARVETKRGQARHGGCVFSAAGQGRADASDARVLTVYDELTFDPATCTSRFAVTDLPADSTLAGSTADGQSADTSQASGAANRHRGAALVSWNARLRAWIEDPIALRTSSTETIRSWNSGGGWSNTHNWNWLSGSGWWRSASGVTDNSTTGDTRGYYINQIFCNPFSRTYADHLETKITTSSSSGSYRWSYRMNKYGDCSSLLSYHYSVS